jgi:hypothetical protein
MPGRVAAYFLVRATVRLALAVHLDELVVALALASLAVVPRVDRALRLALVGLLVPAAACGTVTRLSAREQGGRRRTVIMVYALGAHSQLLPFHLSNSLQVGIFTHAPFLTSKPDGQTHLPLLMISFSLHLGGMALQSPLLCASGMSCR